MRRAVLLAACIGIAIALYVVFVVATAGLPPVEAQFAREGAGEARPLQAYLEILSIDPVRSALSVQLDFATMSGPAGSRFGDAADRDLVVLIADGEGERRVALRRGEAMAPVAMIVSLRRGRIDAYPFDRYTAQLAIDAWEGTPAAEPKAAPLRVVVWSSQAGWDFRITPAQRPMQPGAVDLDIRVRRPLPVRFLAVTLYAAMAMVGCVGLTIGLLLSVGRRQMDTTLAAVLSGMMFALPAMRGVMPGAPPLGVRADALVFLWAELAVVVSLALVIAAWALHSPRR